MHLAGQLAEHLVEIGDGDISILDLPHLDAAVKCAGAGLTERFGERVGIRYGVSKLEPAIPVVVHPDGKDIKLGQSGAGVPVPIHRDPGGLRGDEVCFVVGDQLDAVLAGLSDSVRVIVVVGPLAAGAGGAASASIRDSPRSSTPRVVPFTRHSILPTPPP